MPDQPNRTDASTTIDTDVAHSARVWNYWVGGIDHFPADRVLGDALAAANPAIPTVATAARGFLRRAVRFLVGEVGIRQFLDVGCGLPTAGNVHQIAQQYAPECRVVYVDHDPQVHRHVRAGELLTGPGVRLIDADMYDPAGLLRAAGELLDLTRPVAVSFFGVLGHVPDLDEARDLVRYLMDRTWPGSHLAVCDGSGVVANEAIRDVRLANGDFGALPYLSRTPQEIESFFEGLDWVEPGLVALPRWRPDPDDDPAPVDAFGGIGVRR